MSQVDPSTTPSKGDDSRKRGIRKFLIFGIVIAAAAVGGRELYLAWCFRQTYANLDRAINRKSTENFLRPEDVGYLVAGGPKRSEDDNTIVYTWSSLFQKKSLRLRCFRQTQIVEIALGTENFPEDLEDPRKQKIVPQEEINAARVAAVLRHLSPQFRYRPIPAVHHTDKIYQITHIAPKYADHIRLTQHPLGGLPAGFENVLVLDLFDRQYFHYDGGSHYGGSLIREIGRQAFLLAARDEFRIQTRDRTLREELRVAPDPASWPFTVLSLVDDEGNVEVGILQLTDIEWDTHWEKKFKLPSASRYEDFAAAMEKYSRTDFKRVLKNADFRIDRRKARPHNPECLPLVNKHLAHLSEFSQFVAVRELHREIREAGETPELLAALVRGYSNLGVLTQKYWNSGPKVFLARALLYSERLHATTNGSALALWHRAYARALVGLHRSSLLDLEAVAQLADAPNPDAQPEWVPYLRAYVTSNSDALQRLATTGTDRPMAMLLKLLIDETTFHGPSIQDSASKLVQAVPDCFRARLSRRGHWGYRGDSEGSDDESTLVATTYKQIADISDLPPKIRDLVNRLRQGERMGAAKAETPGADAPVAEPGLLGKLLKNARKALGKKLEPDLDVETPETDADADSEKVSAQRQLARIKERADRWELIRALRDYGRSPADHNEPSLATLAYLLQEVSFLIIQAEGRSGRDWSITPLSKEMQSQYQLLEGHPMRDALAAQFGYSNGPERQAAIQRLADAMESEEVEWPASYAVQTIRWVDNDRANDFQNHFNWHLDIVPLDYAHFLRNYHNLPLAAFMSNLKDLQHNAPQSPATVFNRIARDNDLTRAQITEWEKKFREHVPIQVQIADRYRKARRFDDAERCYLRAASLYNSFSVTKPLAEMYRELGNTSRWLQTLEQGLALDGDTDDKAEARAQIAQYYFDREDYQSAKTYAVAAAESGVASYLQLAARISEKLGEWDQVEQHYQNMANRYPSRVPVWYFWCLRSGRGDLAAARILMERFAFDQDHDSDTTRPDVVIAALLATDQKSKALAAAVEAMKRTPANWYGWQAVLLAHELHDYKLRDIQLQGLVSGWEMSENPLGPYEVEIARLIQADLGSSGKSQLNLPRIEELINRLPNERISEQWYFLGRYLQLRGRAVDARKYMEWCASSPDSDPLETLSQSLAAKWLRDGTFAVPAARRTNFSKQPHTSDHPAIVEVMDAPVGEVETVQFSADARKLIAGVETQEPRLWDISSGKAKQLKNVGEPYLPGTSLSLSPNGKLLVMAKRGTTNVFLWETETGIRPRPLIGHGISAEKLAFAPDGQRLAVYYKSEMHRPEDQGDITIWDVNRFTELKRIPIHAAAVSFLQFLPDGRQLIAGLEVRDKRKLARIVNWDLASGSAKVLAEEGDVIFSAGVLSGNGRRLLTRTSTGAVRCRDAADGSLIASTYLRNGADGIALSPDGELAACGLLNGTIRLWDLKTGQEHKAFTGHLRAVKTLAFTPDGRRLASGSEDMSVRLWSLPADKLELSKTGQRLSASRNSIGMSLVRIPAGEFRMGESVEDSGVEYWAGSYRLKQERPVHRVKISRSFELAQHEVTVAQFREFIRDTKFQTDADREGGMKDLPPGTVRHRPATREFHWQNPGIPQTDNHPVVQVSWNDATEFCKWLSRKEGRVYRLPTEAEWEYACRGGTRTIWHFGNDDDLAAEHANCADAAFLEQVPQINWTSWLDDGFAYSSPVGSFAPNAFGLYDMHGNAAEWCHDDMVENFYASSSSVDPVQHPHSGRGSPCTRGGSFAVREFQCRSASRDPKIREFGYSYVGFRVLRETKSQDE